MTRFRIAVGVLLAAGAIGLPTSSLAQPPRSSPNPPAPPAPLERPGSNSRPDADSIIEGPVYSYGRPVFRLGQDYTLRAGDAVPEAVIVYGNVNVEGRIDRDLVVVFGHVSLASGSSIGGDLAVVAGSATVNEGAAVRGDLTVVGGELDAPPGFAPGGEYVVVGSKLLGGRLEAVVPWITRGLLYGRPIVPDLAWVWWIVAILAFVYVIVNLVFHSAVRLCAETIATKPLTSFLVGLLVLLLLGPVCVLLAVSVVGIAVVPVVICAVFVAELLGRVAVMRWIGMSAVREDPADSQLQSLRSIVLGMAVICIAYIVPVLGMATFAMVGVLGLGAAASTFLSGYRRENPVMPKPPRVVVPPDAVVPRTVAHDSNDMPAASAAPIADRPAVAVAPEFSSERVVAQPSAAFTSDLLAFPHARFLDRLAAFVLDVILVIIAVQLLWVWPFRIRVGDAIPFFMLAYHIGFWAWKGTTVGGIICQLRLVRVDGTPLRFVDALVRGLSSIFSLAVLGLGGLWILRDPEQQAWHDRIAGTYVVKVPRNWPI